MKGPISQIIPSAKTLSGFRYVVFYECNALLVGSARALVSRSITIFPMQNPAEFFEAHGTILVEIRQSQKSHHVFLTG